MSQLLQYYKSFHNRNSGSSNLAPTFEDLSIDDNLSDFQRLVKYAKSSIGLQRLLHVKLLASAATDISNEVTISQIIPLIDLFVADNEPAIRQQLVEQLVLLSRVWASKDEGSYRIILDHVLPTTAKLLEDLKPEVRNSACITLVEVSHLVKVEDLGQYVLTIILRLAHEDDKEDMRMTAAELLNLLAERLGQDLCRQFVIPEVVSLAEDPVFRVRKATALNFHNICKVGGEHELFERLMPAFVRLSKDDMYRVRKACADSLSEISKHVSNDIRVGVLVEIFLRLTQDPSKLVKQSVLQQSGMFISTLPPRAVSDLVLSNFCSMAFDPTGDMGVDSDLRHYCAYSFPAVLLTIGCGRWKEVRDVYHSLVQSRSVNVKQTLAASLHEIARLLTDVREVEDELVPVFEDMIQDVEEVQMGVLKNLAVFLSLLSQPCRVSYLPILHDILHSTNPFNWRLRQALAIQLPELLDLPPVTDVYAMLFPLIMTLLQDPVASVRIVSYKGVAKMINLLNKIAKTGNGEQSELSDAISRRGAQDLDAVIRSINLLVKGETYLLRQLWIELCQQLIRDLPKEMFETHFIEGILKLTCDPVSNVRIAVARFLGGWEPDCLAPWEPPADGVYSPWRWLMQRDDIKECVKRLAVDDYDVYYSVSKLKPLFPDLNFAKISCRGRKIPPGGAMSIGMSNNISNKSISTITNTANVDSSSGKIINGSDINLEFSTGDDADLDVTVDIDVSGNYKENDSNSVTAIASGLISPSESLDSNLDYEEEEQGENNNNISYSYSSSPGSPPPSYQPDTEETHLATKVESAVQEEFGEEVGDEITNIGNKELNHIENEELSPRVLFPNTNNGSNDAIIQDNEIMS